jgi:adenine-specific DNA-methyltransferase
VFQKTTEKSGDLTISYSKEKTFTAYREKNVSHNEIIDSNDEQYYISIPGFEQKTQHIPLKYTNKELGFEISTGPIVDFRMKEKLQYDTSGVPLLYSIHMRNQTITWPLVSKKPNAINLDENEIEKLCFKKGYYILLKRFSSKEEKHRIQATLLTPDDLSSEHFTVENHLNIIHSNRHGLDRDFAFSLAEYLNSDYCDSVFRMFSGHTQVNATDLRNMKYPDLKVSGTWAIN